MKTYFPDDPVKQEMFEMIIGDFESLMDITGYTIKEIRSEEIIIFIDKLELIEKATNEKIEEVLK